MLYRQGLSTQPEQETHVDNCIDLQVIKFDFLTGERLFGAIFSLSDVTCEQRRMTNRDGIAVFRVSPCVNYILREVSPPDGYHSSFEEYRLCFTPDGAMLYEGCLYPPCLAIGNCPQSKFSFCFRKVDSTTGEALPGAWFALLDGNHIVAEAVSDLWGGVYFFGLAAGMYRLLETSAPAGFLPSSGHYTVIIQPDGMTTINGIPSCKFYLANVPFPFLSFRKLAINSQNSTMKGTDYMAVPLQGATFELRDYQGHVLLTATSDASGTVALGNVSPGTYMLVETNTPPGFIPGGPYTVVVSDTGDITVDGEDLADFSAFNYPFPNFAFRKTDIDGDALMGAVFSLDDGFGTVQYATSALDGTVTFFAVRPGQYTLHEVSAPFGYLPDPSNYIVNVAADGTITVNGTPSNTFEVINTDGPDLSFIKLDVTPQSPPPVIDPVGAGSAPITGTGVPGATVTVTWPDTSTSDVIVGPDTVWTATPPAVLVIGQTVTATQTVPNHTISDPDSEIVQAVSAPPTIDDVFVGDADLTGTGIAGSTVTVTWPDGTTNDAPVEAGGTWTATPPSPFVFGQVIVANQTEDGKLPSVNVSTTVQDVSPVPVINQIVEGDPTVTGTGIAGATITVTWPDTTTANTTVGAYGTWIVPAPNNLNVGDIVTATQTVPGMTESGEATQTVLAISPPPDIDVVASGSTSITGTGIAGAEITITWPDGSTSPATVAGDNTWTATAPEPLNTGELISAIQEVSGALPSHPTTTTVIGVSQLPVINGINAGAIAVTGTGVNGSTINLRWPNGATSTTTVALNGTWSAPVPAGETPLVSGTYVHATQTTPGMLTSGEVSEPVVGQN